MFELAVGMPPTEDVLALRVTCTRLVLQATQVTLTAAKGAGFVAPHPVQRCSRSSPASMNDQNRASSSPAGPGRGHGALTGRPRAAPHPTGR